MVSIDTLVKIYKNFGDRENLSPLGSADEELILEFQINTKTSKLVGTIYSCLGLCDKS